MSDSKNHFISKSSFLKGVQCLKALYLSKHHPELRDEISEGQQAIFDMGHEVGILAQQLFPGGIQAAKGLPEGFIESIVYTKELIDNGQEIIYEAGFMNDNLHCFVDILVKEDNGWKIYEVKSSTSVSETNVLDAAFQYHVIKSLGYEVKDVHIVHINNQYVRDGRLDVHQLFTMQSVLEKILPLQDFVKGSIAEQMSILQKANEPAIKIGLQCNDPYECDFKGHCWAHVPEYSVFDIHNLSGYKKFDLYNKGIVELKDIPGEYPLGANQWQQVKAELEQSSIRDKSKIRRFLDELQYPLYFLDFETMNPAIPQYDNNKPYQQIPFQFSLHIQENTGSTLEHIEYLGNPAKDPRQGFIQHLLNGIGDKGDIIVYNLSFEKTRLQELARDFKDHQQEINGIISRLKDLMVPFKQKLYYTPAMRGSYSIKKVLPALVPKLSYEDLEIGEGGLASLQYFRMVRGEIDDVEKVKKDLLEYCKMDTLAMVEILTVLIKL